jgi:hypothetical protein
MCVWTSLNIMHVHALINNSYHKGNKCTNFKIVFLCKIHQNSVFQFNLIVFKELHDINKAYMKCGWIIKYIKICPLNVCSYKIHCIAGQNWFVRCGGYSIIDFTMVYQEDAGPSGRTV